MQGNDNRVGQSKRDGNALLGVHSRWKTRETFDPKVWALFFGAGQLTIRQVEERAQKNNKHPSDFRMCVSFGNCSFAVGIN